MASVSKNLLIGATALKANQSGTGVMIPQNAKNFIGLLKLTNKVGTTVSIDGTVYHSPDNTWWDTLCSFTALTANGIDVQQITVNVFPYVKADVTATGTNTTVQTAPVAHTHLAGGTTTAKATLTVQQVTFTAKTVGVAGNSITVEYKDTGLGGLSVSEVGTDITIDFGGSTPTAEDIKGLTYTLVDVATTWSADVECSVWYDLSR